MKETPHNKKKGQEEKNHDEHMARHSSGENKERRFCRLHRDIQGRQEQIRDGQGDRYAQARPRSLHLDPLPRQLRLYSAHLRR